MADVEKRKSGAGTGDDGDDKNISPQKRKADDISADSTQPKKVNQGLGGKPIMGKITMSLGPKKPGISMNIGSKKTGPAPIKLALNNPAKESPTVVPKSTKVASVFNEESDSEEEEMPMEAKMRMRNVGRETPTAAGPNSFGKGNLGFCDRTKMIERDLKRQMEELGEKADCPK